ncbi:hypothetical protein CKW46_14120 [Mycobacterium liflandii]|nr:hypothetical protein CKW46_14120 [Mycobacterium liflandii]
MHNQFARAFGHSAPVDSDGGISARTGSDGNGHQLRTTTVNWFSPAHLPSQSGAHGSARWLRNSGSSRQQCLLDRAAGVAQALA